VQLKVVPYGAKVDIWSNDKKIF